MINNNLYVLPGLVMFTNPIVRDLIVTLHKGIGECDKLWQRLKRYMEINFPPSFRDEGTVRSLRKGSPNGSGLFEESKREKSWRAKGKSKLWSFSFALELFIYQVLYQLFQQAIINFFYRLRLRVRRKRPKDSTILILQLQNLVQKENMFTASRPSVDGPKAKLIGLPAMDHAFTRKKEWNK